MSETRCPQTANIRNACAGALLVASAVLAPANAASTHFGNDNVTKAGDVLRFAIPAVAGGISLYKGDYRGLAQLGISWTLSVGAAYAISHIVREKRPDGSDWHSFPSDSTASAYAGADYLWTRYGWRYGAPAYVLAAFTGYSRVQAKKHHWYDTAASGVLAFGVNYAIVSHYHGNYQLSANSDGNGLGLNFAMKF